MPELFRLEAPYRPAGDQILAIKQLCEGIDEGLQRQTLLGVTGSGKTFTMANVIQNTQRPTMIMAPNKTLAAQLYGEFKTFFPHNSVEYFVSYYDYYQPEAYVPSSDTFIQKDASVNDHIEQMRLSATKAMMTRRDTIIISSVSAIYGLGDPTSYLQMVLAVSVGSRITERDILRQLAIMQYTRSHLTIERCQFRATGDVIDVFPSDSDHLATRIELFDDEIENIALFDPLTGVIHERLKEVTIFPKSHYVTPRERVLETIEKVQEELKERIAEFNEAGKLVEAQRLEDRVKFDIEMMLELGYCSGIENYSRYLSGREAGQAPPTLFDYLPDDALLMLDESHVMLPQIGAMFKGDRARKKNLVDYGFRLPSALDNRPLQFDEFNARAPQTLFISATPGLYEQETNDAVVEQVVRPTGLVDPSIEVRPASTQIDDVLSEINKIVKKNERVLITTLTKKMAENLTDYLSKHDIKVRYLHSDIDTVERVEIIRDLRLGTFDVLVGINLLREGLDMPEVSLVAILDADKEGFLRSVRSLIQTIGRAARNINGHVILYADRVTGSMQQAMDETDRRRDKQEAYNQAHNITPQGINKQVMDIMALDQKELNDRQIQAGIIEQAKVADLSPKALAKKIKSLEKEMLLHAKNLEFEQAAKKRDELQRLKEQSVF